MTSNDQVILQGILKQRKDDLWPSADESKFFEIFTAEQVLKDYDLSYDEIESGNVGGGDDGGVDGIYGFVQGELITEDTDTNPFKKQVSIDLFLIQAKKTNGFSESAVEKFGVLTRDLFDFSKDPRTLLGVYRADLLEIVGWFRRVYLELAGRFPLLTIHYVYSALGDEVHPKVAGKVEHVRHLVLSLFSGCQFIFTFLGAHNLLDLASRVPKTSYDLQLVETPISAVGGYVCLVRLANYFNFISKPDKSINIAIFEANVRDYWSCVGSVDTR